MQFKDLNNSIAARCFYKGNTPHPRSEGFSPQVLHRVRPSGYVRPELKILPSPKDRAKSCWGISVALILFSGPILFKSQNLPLSRLRYLSASSDLLLQTHRPGQILALSTPHPLKDTPQPIIVLGSVYQLPFKSLHL